MNKKKLKKIYQKHLNVILNNLDQIGFDIDNIISEDDKDQINELYKYLLDTGNEYGNWQQYIKVRLVLDFYYKIIKQKNRNIERIIVYENPPENEHLLVDGNNYYNVISQLEINGINFDHDPTIINLFREIFTIEVCNNIELNFYELDNNNLNQEAINFIVRILTLIENKIVFVDLFCLPVDTNSVKRVRRKWKNINYNEYLISKKRITVQLFILALNELKNQLSNLISQNCMIAIGTPNNTSISIFEYYSDKLFVFFIGKKIYVDLSRINSPMAFKKMNKPGNIFPLYKSNVVGSSNYPEKLLVENAFNLLR